MPFVCHSPATGVVSSLAEDRSVRRPPGITIFPALRVLPAEICAVRGCGKPSAFRCRRVSGLCGGSGTCPGSGSAGGVGGADSDSEDDDVRDVSPDCDESSDSDGVFSSGSTSIVLRRLRRFIDVGMRTPADTPCDSSNVRLGLRPVCAREDMSGGVRGARLDGAVLDVACEVGGERELVSADGEEEREGGRGIWVGANVSMGVEGVRTTEVVAFTLLLERRALPLPLDACGIGSSCALGARSGRSTTLGKPVWGPARFRTEEKCSQSW